MNKLIDKFIIFVFCLALYIPSANHIYMIVPILIAIILSATLSCLDNEHVSLATFFIYFIACFFIPAFLFFIPLICYDILFCKIQWLWCLVFIPLIVNSTENFFLKWLIATFIAVTYILKYRTISFERIKKDYYKLSDNITEV